MTQRVITLGFLFMLMFTASCTQRRVQSAVQSSLTAMAHGLDAASEVLADQLGDAPAAARQHAIEASRANHDMTIDEAMVIYRDTLARWYRLSHALTVVHQSLLYGQSALDIWIATGDLPDQWNEFCGEIGGTLETLVDLLEDLGIDVPELLSQAVSYADTVCEMAAAFFAQQESL